MLCLSRNLGLMIGHQIPTDNKYWKLYRNFRKSIDVLTLPSFSKVDIYKGKKAIKKHNKLFFELCRKIPPKAHNSLHAMKLMMYIGPLIHTWGQPFERKHKPVKKTAIGTSSNNNLLKTVDIDNQLRMCYIKEKCENVESNVTLGWICNDNADAEFKRIDDRIKGTVNARKYSFIKLNGKKIAPGTVIVSSIGEVPEFVEVTNIYLVKKQIYLSAKVLRNPIFVKHFHAWKVSLSSEKCLINVTDLPEVDPCIFHKNKSGHFVGTRYKI